MAGETPGEPVGEQRRRRGDDGWMCTVALRMSQAWDWIDKRQIDAHVISGFIVYGTVQITAWCMHYAEYADRPGMEVAAVIGAVMFPWSGLQAAAVKFYFDARR